MRKALIVDDHEVNLYLLQSVLQGSGYEVSTAPDGRVAYEKACAERPDIIISDILMPVMDGFALCRLCRQDERLKAVPFVFYTATYTDPRDEELALAAGADLFLVKPLEPDVFIARITEVLARCDKGSLSHLPAREVDEVTYLKEYNEALIRKLEQKVADVEQANRALLVKEAAIESAATGVVFTDLEGRISYANSSVTNLFGHPRADLWGARLGEVFQGSPNLAAMREGLATRGEWQGELTTPNGTAEPRTMSASAHVVKDHDGRAICQMVSFEDVTERKRMAEEVQRSQRLASLSLFAAGIAHDFNNLLTALFGNIELARCVLAPEDPGRVHLEAARLAFERARDLTRRLLTFAKGSPPSRRPLDANQLLRECASLALVGSNVRCEISGPPDIWPVVGDTSQLSQVFTNILVNARQAMPQGGVVRVALENRELTGALAPATSGRHVRISITDEGPGIASDVLPHIFDPLFTTKEEGSGLGLAMSYSIVQAHGGRIEVSSRPGRGATFRVVLPATLGEAVGDDETRAEPEAIPQHHARILIMDDEPSLRELAARMLRRGGYEVSTAANGEQTLELCERAAAAGAPFDAVILDVTVPGAMGGQETLQCLRERFPSISAVMSSGYGEEPWMAGERRPDAVLPKPYQVHELLACVRAVTR